MVAIAWTSGFMQSSYLRMFIRRECGLERRRSGATTALSEVVEHRSDSQANGGVPPFGHTTHLRVFIDPDLLQYEEVWAAAGAWNDVSALEPTQLVDASEGMVTDLKKG